MKKDYSVFFIVFLLPILSFAQNPIPNPGFENWNGGEPVDWYSNNIPFTVTVVSQSSTANSGSYAVKGEVANFQTSYWYASLGAGPVQDPYIAVSQNYDKLSGYYQLQTTGSEFVIVTASLLDSEKQLVAFISGALETVTSQYLPFIFDFNYSQSNGNDAAFLQLQFTMSSRSQDSIQVGAYYLIDDVGVFGITDLESVDNIIPAKFKLLQNYPNPFNSSTTVRFNLPESKFVLLKVYDIYGREVETLINGKRKAGIHEVQWNSINLSSGIYFIKMITDDFVSSKKVTLLK